MGSDRLGVVAKMDLVEVRAAGGVESVNGGEAESAPPASASGDLFAFEVCPVDYKAGSPKQGSAGDRDADGPELWDTDKMQLGLQALILRENGYRCREGIIYYRGTKQRVRLPITPELIAWIEETIAEARRTAAGAIPRPLVNSPKCVRCSLAPICLPDETRLLGAASEAETSTVVPADLAQDETAGASRSEETAAPRRLMAARDDARALYLNTPGLRVGVSGEVLQVKEREKPIDTVRVRDLNHVALFGNIQI